MGLYRQPENCSIILPGFFSTQRERIYIMYTFTVPESYPPLELKDLLCRMKVSLTLRRKLKQSEGSVRLNGQTVSWKSVVCPGDTVSIVWPELCQIPPLPIPINVLFEDESLLVVDKPAGFLVHPTTDPTRPSLANAVIWHLNKHSSSSSFHPVHRLDHNTSGLILIAKNPYIQHLFSDKDGINITRSYFAVIHGVLSPEAGTIDSPIGRHPDSIIQRMVCSDGQKALTCYQTIEILGEDSLVRLRLLTGRTHQIRVHLAAKGHPLWGDDLYGGSTRLISRQALHAAELSFTHPLTGASVALTSPLPADIMMLVDTLKANN